MSTTSTIFLTSPLHLTLSEWFGPLIRTLPSI